MKKFLLLSISFLIISSLSAQNWVQKNNFPGTERYSATGFSINGKLYMGTGYNGVTFMNDWWEYNPVTNQWTQKANYPGAPRYGASAFAINNKGYVVFGTTTIGVYTFPNDFWEYDPTTDQWAQKANFPGFGRYTAVGMEINGKGYVGTGWKQVNPAFLSDWWEYDPATNAWTQKASFPGVARQSASSLSLNGFGYVGIGGAGNNTYNDFWQFNPTSNTWSQKANYIGTARLGTACFTINGLGYIGCGHNGEFGNVVLTDFFKYDPNTNSWSFANGLYPTRTSPVALTANNCAYVLTGRTSNTGPTPQNTLTDLWEICSLMATINADDSIHICAGSSATLSANTGGCLSYQWQLNGSNIAGATNSIYTATQAGNYTVIVSDGFGSSTSNIITVTMLSLPGSAGPISGQTTVCKQSIHTFTVNPVPGATGYMWTISQQGQILSGQGTNTITVQFGTKNTKITVVPVNACGYGPASTLTIQVQNCHPLKIGQKHTKEFDVKIFPNPSSGEFFCEITGEENSNVFLTVYDNKGSVLEKIEHLVTNSFVTIGKDWVQGIYFVEVNMGTQRKNIKLIKEK